MESKNIIPIVLTDRKHLHLPYDTSLDIFLTHQDKWCPNQSIAAQFLRLATALYKCGESETKESKFLLLDGFSNSTKMIDPSDLLTLDSYDRDSKVNHIHFIHRNRPERYGFTICKAIYGTKTLFTDVTEIIESYQSQTKNVLYIPKGSEFSSTFEDPAPGLTKTLKITFQLFRRDEEWKSSSPECVWEVSESLPLAIRCTVSDLFNQLFGMYLYSTEWKAWTTYSGLEKLDGSSRVSMQKILFQLSECMILPSGSWDREYRLATELKAATTLQWLVWVSRKYESLYSEIEKQLQPMVLKFQESQDSEDSHSPITLRMLNQPVLNDFDTQWVELLSLIRSGSFLKVHTIYVEEGQLSAFPLILTLVYDHVFLRRISIPENAVETSSSATVKTIPNLRQMHVQKRYTAEELGKLFEY